ncbi:MAG: tetratricopeptide repeat protein [Armatimonadota bacterium]|nr:tetratricopeptide repeat protein [Armatimonadota bacterium]
MRPPTKKWPWLLLLPIFLLVGYTQERLYQENLLRDADGTPRLSRDGELMTRYRPLVIFNPTSHRKTVGKTANLVPAVFFGFKSALADILWVKADGAFHTGRYERIMPICQVITWLDPHFLDVYIIGAWHMAYNFMDWRYIPVGIDFLEKGIHNNPDKEELYFEQGNMLYDKAKDFNRAAKRLREANEMGLQPAGKRHLLAHALENAGRIDEAIAAWESFIKEEEAAGNWQMAAVSRHNRDLTIWRKADRALRAKNPLKVTFDYTWKVQRPRVLRVEGTTNLPDLTKVNVMIRDKNYDQLLREHPQTYWQVTNLTLWWDNFTVKQGKWASWYRTGNLEVDRLDLSSEPAKYPLRSQEYEVIITVNPRVEPIPVQDITGWSGEGITGPHVQVIDGVRMIRKSFTVTRDELLGKGKPPAADAPQSASPGSG